MTEKRKSDRKAQSQSLCGPCATFHCSFGQCDGSMCTCRQEGWSQGRFCREWGRPNDKFNVSHGRASPLTCWPQSAECPLGVEKEDSDGFSGQAAECRHTATATGDTLRSGKAESCRSARPNPSNSVILMCPYIRPVRYVLTRKTLCATYNATTNCMNIQIHPHMHILSSFFSSNNQRVPKNLALYAHVPTFICNCNLLHLVTVQNCLDECKPPTHIPSKLYRHMYIRVYSYAVI